MKKLTIDYTMSYTFGEWDIDCLNREMDYLLDYYPVEDEKELFDSALYNVFNSIGIRHEEIEVITEGDKFDTIYKWWKENRENA